MGSSEIKVSIIIPASNAAATIDKAVQSVLNEICSDAVEIIIVNDAMDASLDVLVDRYPVRVIDGDGSGPAAARNIGVKSSHGEILIFLDADCRVRPGWLQTHLKAHERYGDLLAVGGSISIEPNAALWARCDHFSCWYNVNPALPAGWVPNHPSANLSIARSTFERVGCFKEDLPCAGVHEEIEWQRRFLRLGGRIRFEPLASVRHRDRDDFRSFLKHNYRWGYNSIEVKSGSAISRFPWVYRNPHLLVAGFFPFAILFTLYTIVQWLRVGKPEVLLLSPAISLGRLAYAAGMVAGSVKSIQTDAGIGDIR